MSVWVVAETTEEGVHEASLEALEEARALSGAGGRAPVAVVLGGPVQEGILAVLAAHGAGRVLCLEDEALARWDPEPHAAALIAALVPERPRALLLAHTARGRLLAPRLAVALDAGCATDCVAVRARPDGALEATRPAFGGQLYATVVIAAGVPAVITLRPGAIGRGPADGLRPVRVERCPADLGGSRSGRLRRRLIPPDPRQVDLREADRVVAGGGGVGSAEGFALLQELADLLGAAVGGSRIAVDRGWLPWERQIGQSGRSIAPRLYLAFGISGASQHLIGIRQAETIVAINTDRTAPILSVAHLGIVGDWREVVMALLTLLRARRGGAEKTAGQPVKREVVELLLESRP